MTSPRDVLVKAREIITPPDKWFKGAPRRGVGDRAQYCALGAIYDAAHQANGVRWVRGTTSQHIEVMRDYDCAKDILCSALNGPKDPRTVSSFNDRGATTHADVLAAFDKAIASIEEETGGQ